MNVMQSAKFLKQPKNTATMGQKSEGEVPSFSVSQDAKVLEKIKENYMDLSMKYSPEAILASMKEFYSTIMTNPEFKQLKNALITVMVTGSVAGTPLAAYAEGENLIQGQVTYTQFLEAIKSHDIERIRIAADGRTAEFLNTEGARGAVNLFNDPNLFKLIQDNGIDLSVMPVDQAGAAIFGILNAIAFPLIFFGGLFLLNRSRMNGPGGAGDQMNPFNMGKSKAKVQMEPDTGVQFADVAGVDEAKEELAEVVDFLKQPERYTKLGAKIPRGALLIGPPGTGKTLLAKAVAGEAGVPFFSISAAEFIEMFVGVGASRVRDLFEQAKKNAPCIVFIDELDAVGRQRAQGVGMGNDEREQTINQLLTEMDGFEGNKGVIVLAATNIPEVLDKALLRPGRFDRQIQVGLPDFKGRTRILGVHARDKKLAEDVKLEDIAKRCLGMSGADLANVMNEAAIFGARKAKEVIEAEDIYDAIDRIQIGLEKKGATFSSERQKLVSYHEAGHALLGALMEEYDLVNKITIVPRGGAGGVTIFTPEEEAMESGMYSKSYLENRICVAMGGRIAEEIINGKDKVTTGASNDFQQCTNTAKMMVEQMGMSDAVGPRNISGGPSGPMQMMMGGGAQEGSELKNKVDDEIDRILREQYDRGMALLTEHRDVLDAIANTLIEKEKIDGTQMLNLIKEIKPQLVSEKALEKVKEVVTPAAKAITDELTGGDDDQQQLQPAAMSKTDLPQ